MEERNLEEWGFGYIKDKFNGLKEDIKNKVEGWTDDIQNRILRPFADFLKNTWDSFLRWFLNTMADTLISISEQEFQHVNDEAITCLDLISNVHNGVISVLGEAIFGFFKSIGEKLREEATKIGNEQVEKYTNNEELWNL